VCWTVTLPCPWPCNWPSCTYRRPVVQARQGGQACVAGRFIRRNRLPLGADVGVLLALNVGLAAALWQSGQVRAQAQRAQAAQRFLLQFFDARRPELARGGELSARELLDQSAQRLEAALPDQPALRAELHREIGRICISLGANAPARLQIDQPLGLYGKLHQLQTEAAIDIYGWHKRTDVPYAAPAAQPDQKGMRWRRRHGERTQSREK